LSHKATETGNDARIRREKRKAIGGLGISLEERERRAFKWLAHASSSLLDKNTGMSVVDGQFNCGTGLRWHVRVLSLSGSSDSCFSPFPAKYEEIAASETVMAILYLMQEILQSQTTPFHGTAEREACKKDKGFIGKIMMTGGIGRRRRSCWRMSGLRKMVRRERNNWNCTRSV
jgi:hypothetical protein